MGQSVKCLLCKRKNRNSTPSVHSKRQAGHAMDTSMEQAVFMFLGIYIHTYRCNNNSLESMNLKKRVRWAGRAGGR